VGWRGRDRGRRGVERECVSVRGGGGKRKKERGDEQGWGGERVRLIVSGEIVRGGRGERGREGGGGGERVRLIVRGRGEIEAGGVERYK
jgi:hypothetical protein